MVSLGFTEGKEFMEELMFGKVPQQSWGEHGEGREEERQSCGSPEAGKVFWKPRAVQFHRIRNDQAVKKEGREECGACLREAGAAVLKGHTEWVPSPLLPAGLVTLTIISLHSGYSAVKWGQQQCLPQRVVRMKWNISEVLRTMCGT